MKQLLYTLMVGLAIISCNKEELNSASGASSINAIEQPSDPMSDVDVSGIITRLQDAAKSKSPSTGKDSDNDGVQDAGSYILIKTITDDNNYWEFALSEDVADAYCAPGDYTFTDIYLVLQSDNSTNINYLTIDGTTVATIEADLSSLYGLTYESGYKLRFSDLDAQSITATDNSFTFTE